MIQNYNYDIIMPILCDRILALPTRTHNPSIIEYAETTIVPSGKYRGVRFNHNRAPQLKEPLSLLSPDSYYQDIIFMSPAQYGKSTLAELMAMYYIQEVPSEIMYVSSNETAAQKWLERRIVPRAAAAGIVFRTEIESKSSRKTGDTSISKIFPGGNIDAVSALSPAQLASETKRIIIGDETDRWRLELGDEGSVLDMIRARTQAWGNQAKRLWISSPTTEQNSLINKLFLTGDQRFYHVPCPYCGTMQLMDFSYDRGFGLKWEHKNGKIDRRSIVLICENTNCMHEIKESSKHKMLNGGEWRKSAVSQYDYIASFNSNGLYSHMLSWYDMVVAYEEAQTSEMKKQAFDNLKMGRPHRSSGSRPKAEKLLENRGRYRSGDVPEGVLYLTMGCDVQRGSEKDTENPPRIECTVLGIGASYKTWVILHKVFEGGVSDPYGGAWEKLHEWAIETELSFVRPIDGFKFQAQSVFIDSGDGENTATVYEFCHRWRNTIPCKGQRTIKKRKNESSDELTESSFKRYRYSKISEDVTLAEISTIYYKDRIYSGLNIKRLPVEPQRSGFIDFPVDFGERYFDMLTAEEKMQDGSYKSYSRRNEALDCMVYAMASADAWLDAEVLQYKSWAKQNGADAMALQMITHKYVIDQIEKSTAIRRKAT